MEKDSQRWKDIAPLRGAKNSPDVSRLTKSLEQVFGSVVHLSCNICFMAYLLAENIRAVD